MVRVRPSAAAAMEGAGHQVSEGSALVLVQVQPEISAAAVFGGGGMGGGGKEPAGLPCPRCESTDTKFCYYNNYNLGQPRHFCKGCRRYWTRGGALRNVPVGGGTRKATPAARRHKRPSSSSTTASPSATFASPPQLLSSPAPLSMSAPAAYAARRPAAAAYDLSSFMPSLAVSSPMAAAVDPDRRLLDLGGSFSSLLAPAPDVRFSAGFRLGGGGGGGVLAPHMMPPASSAPAHAHHALLPPPPPMSQALPEGLIWSMGWPDLSI